MEQINHIDDINAFIEQLLVSAANKGCSDLHIAPDKKVVNIRFRVNGLLYMHKLLNKCLYENLVTALKIKVNLDITEKRLPQDGSFNFTLTEEIINLRISTLPSIFGEKIVIRFLSSYLTIKSLEEVGLHHNQLEILKKVLKLPQGLILFTGSTGSGKTHTLYSMLLAIASTSINIITIEDPVEIVLPSITQVCINNEIGLNFNTAIKSILRQDPDVIMLGEIRDKESANAAISLAQTGHLVLASMHARDNLQAILRLLSFNLKEHDLLSCLLLLSSQKLYTKEENEKIFRTAAFNFLSITNEIQELILTKKFEKILTYAEL